MIQNTTFDTTYSSPEALVFLIRPGQLICVSGQSTGDVSNETFSTVNEEINFDN